LFGRKDQENGIIKRNHHENKIPIYFDEAILDAIIYKDIYMG